ncbi:MAG TPA: hypothetical protein VNO70_07230 [Blastocatellia bacterium]|nr:hypothetical protein [Blastocatellia bacterium]
MEKKKRAGADLIRENPFNPCSSVVYPISFTAMAGLDATPIRCLPYWYRTFSR